MIVALTTVMIAGATPSPDVRCGSHCLYVSLKALDFPVDSHDDVVRRLGDPSALGYSLGQLQEVAESFGAQTLAVKTSTGNLALRSGRFACIAHLPAEHFVLIAAIDDETVKIIDPPREEEFPRSTIDATWDGVALLLSREPLTPESELGPLWSDGSVVPLTLAGALFLVASGIILRRRLAAGRA